MHVHEVYTKDQLIPYIGNKRKLLHLVRKAISATGVSSGLFLDLFSGSSVVARLAKTMGYRVAANDWEPYTRPINQAYICNNQAPSLIQLGGLQSAIERLNALGPVRGYISAHYCPADDECPDFDRERMFYTQENGRRIDAIRECIAEWRTGGVIDENEEAVLLAPLIFQSAYCSNTSGVFKGFHRGWGGATKTAWYRIRSKLTLRSPVFFDNQQQNISFSADANEVATDVDCDIAYIDPPYNQHQYGANYHMLNSVALWDKPPLSPCFDTAGGIKDKAGIRKDWRLARRSKYCCANTALEAFAELVGEVRARHILVSYSTDGFIPIQGMLECLSDRGALTVHTHSYKRYRVSRQRPSARPHTTEFVLAADTAGPRSLRNAREIEDAILRQSEDAQLAFVAG